MKLVLIAAVSLLASCKDRPRESPPAPGPGSSAPPAAPAAPASPDGGAAAEAPGPDVCRISLLALEQASCPTAEARQGLLATKKSIDSVVETIGKVAGADPRQFQVMCAQMLLAIEQDAAKLSCTIALDARQRAEITAMLDAWYAQRTPVVPTGDAAADAVIAKIAAVRDAACECRDAACLQGLEKQLGAVGAMPQAAPAAARTLGSKLLEDAGRCASRVRMMSSPPKR
jgi:hypothetical protein